MAGTLATFAGLKCSAAMWSRTRGYDADISTVEIPVASFPAGFEFVPAEPGAIAGAIDKVIPDLAVIRSGGGTSTARPAAPRGAQLPGGVRLVFAGTLCLAEDQDEQWQVIVHPLFVLRVDRVRAGAEGNAIIRLTLADIRFFWPRGFLRRWSWNRLRGDGELAPDSLKPGGAPWTFFDIAGQACASLPRTPKLSASPSEWANGSAGPFELPRFSPAVSAMGELERRGGVEPPCLRIDGSVAFHRPGEGRLGYAPEGAGENVRDLPDALKLWKQGRGSGYTIEAAYPTDYAVIVGRERIATIAIDDWEPVLLIFVRAPQGELVGGPAAGADPREEDVEPVRGDEVGVPRVLPLDDENVRKLSKGKLTLDGLRRWVMQPLAYQDAIGLEESVARLFRDQAWRLWRLPGAEEKNLHLLPLLPRAETVSGRRAPIAVQAYFFKARHRAFSQGSGPGGEVEALAESRKRMQLLRDQIEALARLQRKGSPFSGREASLSDNTLSIGDLLGPGVGLTGGASSEDLQRAMDRGRLINRIRDVDPGSASEFERELRAQAEAEGALNGTPSAELLALGKKAADFARQLREARDASALDTGRSLREFLSNDANAKRLLETFRAQIQADLRALQEADSEATTRSRAGARARDMIPPSFGPTFLRNLERAEDAGAQVYSSALGIVQTSDRAGWVEEEGVPSPADTRFVPKPVRVIFGAVVRPKTDAAPQGAGPTQQRAAPGGQHAIGDLADAVTWFARAFRRAGRGVAVPLPVEEVPAGEGDVIPIDENELIPLVGDGNTAVLEEKAERLAIERFQARPVVESATYVFARPWPIQCDGVVASVRITMREDGLGFETVVSVGSGVRDPDPMRTRVRPAPPRGDGDAARREGTAP